MKKASIIFAAMFMSLMMVACQSESTVGKSEKSAKHLEKNVSAGSQGGFATYSFRDFSAIQIGGAVEVIYKQDANYSIRIEERPDVETKVKLKDHKLYISSKSKKGIILRRIGKRPKVYVTSPHLNELDISGASLFTSSDMKQAEFSIEVSGASSAKFGHLECSKIEIDASGAYKVSADVKAPRANVELSGASRAEIKFVGKDIEVENSGASRATLDLDCEVLKGDNSGASHMTVRGYVDEVKVNTSGASKTDTSELNKD